MNIIIFGINRLSRYIASILSQESYGVYLVDSDRENLDKISSELDVSVIHETENTTSILEELADVKPEALLALTDNDEKNLILCKIAKNLNYPLTIALVINESYVTNEKLNFNEIFSVDFFICPNIVSSYEIFKYLGSPDTSDEDNFSHGAIYVQTVTVPDQWPRSGKKIHDLSIPEGAVVALIKRSGPETENESPTEDIIFPTKNDVLLIGDEVTFIGKPEAIHRIGAFLEIPLRLPESAVLIGGNSFAVKLAQNLREMDIKTTIIESDGARSEYLSRILPDTEIFHRDGTNVQFLTIEQIGKKDLFIACTNKDDTNILAASIGKEIGCGKTIAVIQDTHFGNVIEKARIDHYISPREAMSNRILAIIQKEKIVSISSLYEDKAKMVELRVTKNSPVAGIPLFELKFYLPKEVLFTAIRNRGRIMMVDEEKVLCPGDTVIVVADPIHYPTLKKLF